MPITQYSVSFCFGSISNIRFTLKLNIMSDDDSEKGDKIYGGKYKRGNKIGQGSFGKIFMGINVHTNEFVAIKQVNT